jgi:integron integrase
MSEKPPQPPRFLDQIRNAIRLRRMSYRTEQAYVDWAKRFILFHNKRHPKDMGAPEIEAFIAHLVNQRNVAASTQNQALHALLFVYREVLQIELPRIGLPVAKKEPRLPEVFTREEVQAILARMEGKKWLMASLLYGTGMRLRELLRLRVKDIAFQKNQIVVREGKGGKDRVTMLPQSLKEPLQEHLVKVKAAHEVDLREGFGNVELPFALDKKYPHADREWKWQYVFPAPKPDVRTFSNGIGPRYPHGAGTARSCGCQHDDGLHACPESGRPGRPQSAGPFVACRSPGSHLLFVTFPRIPIFGDRFLQRRSPLAFWRITKTAIMNAST